MFLSLSSLLSFNSGTVQTKTIGWKRVGRPKVNWIEDSMAEEWEDIKLHFPHEPQNYFAFVTQKEAIKTMAVQRRAPFATKAQVQRNENTPENPEYMNENVERGNAPLIGRGRVRGRGRGGKGRRGGFDGGKGKSWTVERPRRRLSVRLPPGRPASAWSSGGWRWLGVFCLELSQVRLGNFRPLRTPLLRSALKLSLI